MNVNGECVCVVFELVRHFFGGSFLMSCTFHWIFFSCSFVTFTNLKAIWQRWSVFVIGSLHALSKSYTNCHKWLNSVPFFLTEVDTCVSHSPVLIEHCSSNRWFFVFGFGFNRTEIKKNRVKEWKTCTCTQHSTPQTKITCQFVVDLLVFGCNWHFVHAFCHFENYL